MEGKRHTKEAIKELLASELPISGTSRSKHSRHSVYSRHSKRSREESARSSKMS